MVLPRSNLGLLQMAHGRQADHPQPQPSPAGSTLVCGPSSLFPPNLRITARWAVLAVSALQVASCLGLYRPGKSSRIQSSRSRAVLSMYGEVSWTAYRREIACRGLHRGLHTHQGNLEQMRATACTSVTVGPRSKPKRKIKPTQLRHHKETCKTRQFPNKLENTRIKYR